jgi:hypothetical protein
MRQRPAGGNSTIVDNEVLVDNSEEFASWCNPEDDEGPVISSALPLYPDSDAAI